MGVAAPEGGRADEAGAGARALREQKRSAWGTRAAWLPIPIFLTAIIVSEIVEPGGTYESRNLAFVLNFATKTVAAAFFMYLAGRSFVAQGSPGLLLMGCGVGVWGAAGFTTSIVGTSDANFDVTVTNLGAWAAALCHLAGVAISVRPHHAVQRPRAWLVTGYTLALSAAALAALATKAGWLPDFFVPGEGGTLVRHAVLGSAIAMFALTAVLLWESNRAGMSPFVYWYTLALSVIAVGLLGMMVQATRYTVLDWTCRATQYLGAIYMLVAALLSRRRSGARIIVLGRGSGEARYRYGLAIVIVAAAAVVRLAFLEALETRAIFATFYPAVVLAALYGGLRPGLVATALSGLIVAVVWMEPVGSIYIAQSWDLLAMAVFFASCTMICYATEAMHRATVRVREAETQARVAEARRRDLEALRQKDAALAEAQRLAHVGSWYWDARTDVTVASEELLRIYGFDPATEVMPGFREQRGTCYPVEDWERVDAAVQETVRTGAGYALDVRAFRNGAAIWVTLRSEAVRDGEGRVIGLRGTAQDITARRHAEAALREAHDELEERVRERTAELERRTSQLRSLALELSQAESRERKRLATILHDHLQQLMVGARLGVELTEKQTDDAAVLESLKHVRDLLEESIKASRSLTVELSPPILHEGGLVPAVRWLARWMGEKHGLSVEVAAEADVPPDAEGICVLLFQSIRELLFNVVKHGGVTAARVAVTADGEMLRTTVSDRGVGFDVVEAHERGTEAGFGLFSIRERIDLLGGRMDIDSTPGLGTRVTVLVPLPKRSGAAGGAAGGPPEPSAGEAEAAKPASGRRIRVVAADDHKIMREGLIRLIQGEKDMEVVGEASDGQEAVEAARKLRPDVVIMDMSMPRMNGVEATEKITAELPGVCVIGLSMYEKADREEAMRKAGALAYLSKDGPSQNLIAAIRSCTQSAPAGHVEA